MKTELVAIGKIKPNKENPRLIKDDKFKKLVNSIKEFPEMLEIRPIVVNNEMVVLGGNMRLKACKEAKLKKVHIIKAEDLTEEQQKRFIISDNVGFGEWDWDIIANQWDSEKINEWGLDVWAEPKEDKEEPQNINTESITLTIKCDSVTELEKLKTKLDLQDNKISYKNFLIKAGL